MNAEHQPGAVRDERPGDPAVQAIAREVDRSRRYMERLDERVRALAGAVADLHGEPAPCETPQETAAAAPGVLGPGVRSWLLADDPAQAAADLDDLMTWVRRVYLWFPGSELSACWLWHPAAIEELWCLRVAHADAFDPRTGSVMRVADWHERLRPGVAARVERSLRICTLNRHAAFNGRPVEILPPDPPAMARHAANVALVWTTGTDVYIDRAAGPDLGPEHLAEAQAHENRQSGRRR
ncbi:MAG: hypothetical protein H0X35_12435 [Pseudonocardiales bacterium]|nr:hypothetical protein [Pseudonocardiales bacterium]